MSTQGGWPDQNYVLELDEGPSGTAQSIGNIKSYDQHLQDRIAARRVTRTRGLERARNKTIQIVASPASEIQDPTAGVRDLLFGNGGPSLAQKRQSNRDAAETSSGLPIPGARGANLDSQNSAIGE